MLRIVPHTVPRVGCSYEHFRMDSKTTSYATVELLSGPDLRRELDGDHRGGSAYPLRARRNLRLHEIVGLLILPLT